MAQIISDLEVQATALAWHKLVTTIYENDCIPTSETLPSKRQTEYLAYEGQEALFGGAAGGGKTFAILMAALQYCTVPNYSALLIRKTYKHLNQDAGLIQTAKQWIGSKAVWREKAMAFTFPSGASLTFGYLENFDDTMQYQGGAWQFIGFDELSQMRENCYTYLFSRLRKPDHVCKNCRLPLVRDFGGPFSHKKPGTCNSPEAIPMAADKNGITLADVPLRVRAASNPGGPSHEFVKRRFVVKGAPKHFVPSNLDDNPGLNKEEYIKSLAQLDPVTRAQLLEGRWDVYEGGRFHKNWFREFFVDENRNGDPVYKWSVADVSGKIHNGWPTCPHGGVPVSMCWNLITCDPAASDDDKGDYMAIGVFAVTPNGEILVLEVVREKLPLEQIIPRIEGLCNDYSPMFVGIENVAFQLGIIKEGQRSLGVAIEKLNPEGKGKLVRATPAVIRASEGQVFIPKDEPQGKFPWLDDFLAELVTWTGDEKMDAYSDQVDCFAWAVLSLVRHGLACPIVITPDDDTDSDRELGIFMSDGN